MLSDRCLPVLSCLWRWCIVSNSWMDQDATLSNTVCPADCVRWGPSSPNKGARQPPAPNFSAHVYCGQTAAWIKMPLGMDVGFGQGYVTLDGTYSSPKQGDIAAPHFWPMSIVAMQTAGRRYRPRSTRRCVRLPLHGKWHSSHSLFNPLCSGTVAHLSCC